MNLPHYTEAWKNDIDEQRIPIISVYKTFQWEREIITEKKFEKLTQENKM